MKLRPPHFERLLKLLRRKGRSYDDAEDLIQEAMLRLHVYRQGEAVENEEAFLVHAVHNLSIDLHRRQRSSLRLSVAAGAGGRDGVAPNTSVEDSLQAQQRLRSITALLDAGSRRTREIYFAHRAGYSYAEIASHMQISHITIKRHIARALLLIMEHGPFE